MALIFCSDDYFPKLTVNSITLITFHWFWSGILLRKKVPTMFYFFLQKKKIKCREATHNECYNSGTICFSVSYICTVFIIIIWKYFQLSHKKIKILFSLRIFFSFQIIEGWVREPFQTVYELWSTQCLAMNGRTRNTEKTRGMSDLIAWERQRVPRIKSWDSTVLLRQAMQVQ